MSTKTPDTDSTEPTTGPHIPKGAKQPQDHKAKKKTAAQLEAEGVETLDVEWRDMSFTIGADPDDWTLEIIEAFENNRGIGALRGVLGADQWAEVAKTKPRKRDLDDLSKVIVAALGLGDGGN